jgi:hypothetical protein
MTQIDTPFNRFLSAGSRRLSRAALAACVLAVGGAAAVAADKPSELLKPAEAKPAAEAADPSAAGAGAAAAVPPPPVAWKKVQLSTEFLSEGAAAGDFNHDGKTDVVSGGYWYEGPDFAPDKRRAFSADTKPYDPYKYSKNFVAYAYDFNADGWDDILVYGFPGEDASWYENPKAAAGRGRRRCPDKPWVRHKVLDVVDNESPQFADVDGDGKPDLVCMTGGTHKDGGQLGYATADWSDPAKPWTFHAVGPRSKAYQRFTHGLGVGDVNGDGRWT